MLPTRRLLSFTLLLTFTLSACTGGAANNDGPTPTRTAAPLEATHVSPTATSASPDSQAVATPTPEPPQQVGEVVILSDEPPPPSDYVDILLVKVEAGEITYEQGLIAALKLYAGDASGLEVLGDEQPVTGEGNTLLGLVHEYLATGSDPAAKAELQRLLNIIAPSTERLLEYAAPEPAGSGGGLRSLAPRLAGAASDPACQELWAEGFPPGKNVVCILYTEVELTNGIGRVFYPASWWPSDPNLVDYAQAAAYALILADQTFAQFGPMRAVDMVFTMLDSPPGRNALATMVTEDKQASSCKVILWSSSTGLSRESFQQVVAHEVFHCFQLWNTSAFTSENYTGNSWWLEGTAEYFSNVVYPTTDYEFRWVDSFDKKSATLPLPLLSYENTVFFQYLGNIIGNDELIALLQSLPADSDPLASARALVAAPGMQETFHQFAQAWADRRIGDTGGGMLPSTTYIAPENLLVVGTADLPLQAPSLMVQRYELSFKPQNRFGVAASSLGGDSMRSARLEEAQGGWAELPAQVVPGCENYLLYVYVLTSATEGYEGFTANLHSSMTEDLNCMPTPEAQPAPQGQTACDHPYLPLRPGATWTYSHPNGPRTWIVDSVTADTDSQATALMRALVAGQEFTYTWNCSVAGGLTLWWSGSVDDVAEEKCQLAEAEGVLLRTNLALGTEWVSHTKAACSGSSMLGVNGTMVAVTDDILKVIGFDKVTLPDGQIVDGLQIDRQGTTFSQAEVEGIKSKAINTEHHYTWVLARGVGIIQFGEDMTLVSYSIP